MKKFNRIIAIDVIKELANDTCANYVKYFINHEIDTKDIENPFGEKILGYS